VVVLIQLIYPPPAWTTGTTLPVGTGKSIERERERERERGRTAASKHELGSAWQPGHMAENRGPPFTDEVTDLPTCSIASYADTDSGMLPEFSCPQLEWSSY